MTETNESLPEVYVQPGESHLVHKPVILRTLLGSCVGITFWVPRLGLAAICHAVLPICPAKPQTELSLADSRRYVDFAISDIARQFDSFGARRSEVQVKLFGGGDVLPLEKAIHPTIGKLNCESALRALREERLEIVASSLGGSCGLNIQFDTGSGEVLLRRLG